MVPHPLIHAELSRQRALELRTRGRGHYVAGGPDPEDRSAREIGECVERARAGDAQAWEALVARFTPALRSAARSYRLGASDVEDAVQATWVAAFRHIDGIREAAAFQGWLLVTVRREAIRTLRARQREVPVADLPERAGADEPQPASGLLSRERRQAVWNAVELLPARQQALLRALFAPSEPTYDELSRALDMPIGAIGPTRQRALAGLRRNRELRAVAAPDSGAAARS